MRPLLRSWQRLPRHARGDGTCEAGKLVPSTKGICSRDRDADLMCAASF
ncbi:MAG: hypothetical protein ACOYM9_26300 [Bradymonadia bacterium]